MIAPNKAPLAVDDGSMAPRQWTGERRTSGYVKFAVQASRPSVYPEQRLRLLSPALRARSWSDTGITAQAKCAGQSSALADSGNAAAMDHLELTTQSSRSLKALGIILDAWEEGAEAGVAPEMMAYAALFTGLTDLVGAFGEDAVAALLGRLVNRVESGEFSLNRSLQ
jgi:hypothetical protein